MPGAFTSKKRLAYMGSASSSSSSSLHPLNGGVADPSSVFHQSQQQQVSSDSLLAHEGFSSEIKLQPKKNDWTSSTKTIHESFHHSISNSSSRSTRPSLKASSSLPSSIHVNHSYPFHPLKMYQHHPEVFGTSSLNEPQHIQLEFMKPHSLVFSSTSSLSSSTMNHSNTTHKSSSSNGEDHSHETDDTATKAKNKISRYASLPDHIYVKPMSYNNSTTTTTSPHYLAPPPPTVSEHTQASSSTRSSLGRTKSTSSHSTHLHPNYVPSDSYTNHRKMPSNHMNHRRREAPVWQECASATSHVVTTSNSVSTPVIGESHDSRHLPNTSAAASQRIPDFPFQRSYSPYKFFQSDSQSSLNTTTTSHRSISPTSDSPLQQQDSSSSQTNLGNEECHITVTDPPFPPSVIPKHRFHPHKKHYHISKNQSLQVHSHHPHHHHAQRHQKPSHQNYHHMSNHHHHFHPHVRSRSMEEDALPRLLSKSDLDSSDDV